MSNKGTHRKDRYESNKQRKEETGMINIKETRADMGLSQSEFAEIFGISLNTLQEWESGRKTPPKYVEKLIFSNKAYQIFLVTCQEMLRKILRRNYQDIDDLKYELESISNIDFIHFEPNDVMLFEHLMIYYFGFSYDLKIPPQKKKTLGLLNSIKETVNEALGKFSGIIF